MNVLVVGGAGYVGGAVTDFLSLIATNPRASRIGVTSLDLRVYDSLLYEESYRKHVPFVHGDVRDRAKLKEQLKWADAVIWLAALVGDPVCASNVQEAEEVNYESVKWLSENFKGRIVFPSTCSVYGMRDGILDEKGETHPLSIYASTKLKAEGALAGKDAVIFRLGTLFGVGDDWSRIRLDLAVNIFAARAVLLKSITVYGGEQWRPFLHVRDAAEAMIMALTKVKPDIYNLAYTNITIAELAGKLKNIFPLVEVTKKDIPFEDQRNYRVTTEKAEKGFGFKPVRALEKGIAEVKLLLEEGRIPDALENPRYSNVLFLNHRRSK